MRPRQEMGPRMTRQVPPRFSDVFAVRYRIPFIHRAGERGCRQHGYAYSGALSAAILNHALSDGDSSELSERLKERNIPFVRYSGFSHLDGVCGDVVHVSKPASPAVLVTTVVGLLQRRPTLHLKLG